MTKREFLNELEKKLSGLPQKDVTERLAFYGEMIDDRMEEGLSEEQAVRGIGSAEEIATEIMADMPLTKIAKERFKKRRRLGIWEIVLLALGFPIWFSLGIALLSVIFSVYVCLWSVIVSFWAVFVSFCASAIGMTAAGIFSLCIGRGLVGVTLIGAGIFLAGLAVFLFFGCKAVTKGIIWITKKMALGIKRCFVKKEARYE